jgi:predicted HTH domain antitoxin
MNVVIPEEVLHAARLSENELKVEIAVMLFEREKLSLGQASQHLLASRNVPVHYDVADFEEDLETLRGLGRR